MEEVKCPFNRCVLQIGQAMLQASLAWSNLSRRSDMSHPINQSDVRQAAKPYGPPTPLRYTRIPFKGTTWVTKEQRRHALNNGARVFVIMEYGKPIEDP